MRTLFVSPDFKPDRGGIAELYLNLLLRFPKGAVEVATVRAPSGWRDDFPFPVTRLPMSFRASSRLQNVARWALWARRRVRERGYDALQIGTFRPAAPVGAWVHRREGVPFVVYVHGKDVLKELAKARRSAAYRAGTRDVLRRAGALIANSRFTAGLAADLGRAAGVPEAAGRVRIVHPGTDAERFRPGSEGVAELRSRLGLAGRRVVLTVARLERRKGVDVVLDALAALVEDFPDLVYVIVGEGPEREPLEARASALGLRGRVRFAGQAPDGELPAYYRTAEVFLLVSRREAEDEVEGFGIALLEAGASGLPVIGGRSGGVPEAVAEGRTGLLVDPSSPGAVAAALRRLLADRELAERLGRGGREAVLRSFNWDRAAAEAWGVVEEVARA